MDNCHDPRATIEDRIHMAEQKAKAMMAKLEVDRAELRSRQADSNAVDVTIAQLTEKVASMKQKVDAAVRSERILRCRRERRPRVTMRDNRLGPRDDRCDRTIETHLGSDVELEEDEKQQQQQQQQLKQTTQDEEAEEMERDTDMSSWVLV